MKDISSRYAAQFAKYGAKPSINENNGLNVITGDDQIIFSPGISTAGFAEVRMALDNPNRKIIATTIDKNGLQFTQNIIEAFNVLRQITLKLEDLTKAFSYKKICSITYMRG